MKLEYLDQISKLHPEDRILRIYDFDETELSSLVERIDQILLDGGPISFETFECISLLNCGLTMKLGQRDRGVFGEAINLVCEMSAPGYREMRERIQSYAQNISAGTHQWLYDLNCAVDFLLSQSGEW